MKRRILRPLPLFGAGLALGVVSRLLDIYTQNLGNIFSQTAVWILMGVLISLYSSSPKKAMQNILPFCVGMLITYYCTAVITKGVYSSVFIVGWTVFALASPLLAYFTWFAKEKGAFAKLIGVGIVLTSVLSTILLFDRLRIYDYFLNGLLIYFLFIRKIER